MFKLNIYANNMNYNSVITVVSSLLWYHRLEHVNFKRLYEVTRLNLLLLLYKIQRFSSILELKHSDVSILHIMPILGWKDTFCDIRR